MNEFRMRLIVLKRVKRKIPLFTKVIAKSYTLTRKISSQRTFHGDEQLNIPPFGYPRRITSVVYDTLKDSDTIYLEDRKIWEKDEKTLLELYKNNGWAVGKERELLFW